jgi:uncharacterized repeat protein (TIGR03803 family)
LVALFSGGKFSNLRYSFSRSGDSGGEMTTSANGKFVLILLLCSALAVGAANAQTLASLSSFSGTNGANPHSSLVLGTDGNFYGTTYYGGTFGYGTVFQMTPGGTLTVLHNFNNVTTDGAYPYGPLVQGTDGNLYGTTYVGGRLGGGSIFKITFSGTFTLLYSFGGAGSGTLLYGGLVQGTDGNFYGTTYQGGTTAKGTIFQITPAGVLTTIHNFAGTDGAGPYATMIFGNDGKLYGTTNQGGTNNLGTVFSATTAGSLTTLYSFAGPDGKNPYAPLVQGSDGNFYGTTYQGGIYNNGSVFQITAAGTLTTLHSFCSPTNCTDGSLPYAGLTQARNGNFYGAGSSGGTYGAGVVFKITSSGTLTSLHSFTGTDGRFPYAGLAAAPNGNLYGTTYSGGTASKGTVYTLSPTPYQFTALPPCRLLDTRTGNPIRGGTYQSFNLVQLAQQNGCGDLSTASLYSLNVTLVPYNGGPVSYLTIWPTGQAQPNTSTMNSPDGRTKANAAIVQAGENGAVNVYVSNITDVILDINGYFTNSGPSTLQFFPLPPCRVADTRGPTGGLGGPYLQRDTERDFQVRDSNCGIPSSAQAYSLNFTVVPYNSQPLNFLTVWPAGSPQPGVSTLNNPKATTVANAAIVPAGPDGSIAVYPTANTQLIIDVNGYFANSGTGGLSIYPALPCRVLDTRAIGNGQPFSGTLNPAVNVVGSPCAVPAAAQAYVFNATVLPSPTLGYLTLWADTKSQPGVSTLNANDGATASNMAVVPTVNGKIDAYAAGRTQLILDITSYFAP